MRNLYVHARKRVPAGWIKSLRQTPLLSLARRMQPQQQAIYRLEAPLSGFRMSVPINWAYSMTWGSYEVDSCQVIAAHIRPGQAAIDIGGHVGYHTLLMAKLVDAAGRVFCFEPVASNRAMIRQNLALNNMTERVFLEPLAVADRVSLMTLYAGPTSSEASLTPVFEMHDAEHQAIQIAATCDLDTYFELRGWPPVHFIKMDIEGAETLAIRGMTGLLERFHPTLLVETHGDIAREGLQMLAQLGYDLQCLDQNGNIIASDFQTRPIQNEHWVAII